VKQTGLISSGGYIWGTYGMDRENDIYDQISKALAGSPANNTVVMVDFPSYAPAYISMALIADPGLRRILLYDSKTKTYLINDLAGLRPKDDMRALSDVDAYWWNLPIDSTEAAGIANRENARWVRFKDGKRPSIVPYSNQAE
jgi:hypothetical protein